LAFLASFNLVVSSFLAALAFLASFDLVVSSMAYLVASFPAFMAFQVLAS